MKDSDAFILMQFRDAIAPIMAAEKLDAKTMESAARPYFERLKKNGHEWPDAISLMRAVILDFKKGL
jgi:hypothetical protein